MSMMTAFCENLCHASVDSMHEIGNDDQTFFSPIKTILCCKTFNKLNILYFFKAILPLSKTSYNFLWHRNHHFRNVFNELETSSVFPLPVGPDTTQVNGCANRMSIAIT